MHKEDSSPPRNCPCCNSPGFVKQEKGKYVAGCSSCGVRTEPCSSSGAAKWIWNKRFDGQYGITARELEASVVTRLRNWHEHWGVAIPPSLEHPERHSLEQVITGCLSFLHLRVDDAK